MARELTGRHVLAITLTAFGVVIGVNLLLAVKAVGTFPAGSHPPVTYPFAVTRLASAESRALLAFLAGPATDEVWRRFGFSRASQ